MQNRTIEMLPVRLTREEKEQASTGLAEALDQEEKLELELAGVKREFKDRAEELTTKVRHLGRLVRTGVEERTVECEVRPNWRNGTMETFRLDTGEMVNFRPLSREERQRELSLEVDDETH